MVGCQAAEDEDDRRPVRATGDAQQELLVVTAQKAAVRALVVTAAGAVMTAAGAVVTAAGAVVTAQKAVVTAPVVRAATLTKQGLVMSLDVVVPLPCSPLQAQSPLAHSPLQAQSPAEAPCLPLPPLFRSPAALQMVRAPLQVVTAPLQLVTAPLQVVTAPLQVVTARLPPATRPPPPAGHCPFPPPPMLSVFAVVSLESVMA
jgi:hypothetical protein